jgi:molybdenum cofactor synthesis domain-containing protein
MKQIPTIDAQGHVLCHDITRIVRGVTKGVAFSKGHVVRSEDIPALLALGKEHLYVWEDRQDMLHENEAAEILYSLCANAHMSPTPVREGKIEVAADIDGLFQVDIEKLRAVNSLGDMMIATRHTNSPVKKGARLAATRIIPLMIGKERMQQAQSIARGGSILTLHPYRRRKVGIITTGSEIQKGLIKDTFTPVLRDKLSEFDAPVIGHVVLGDDPQAIVGAILDFIEKGADLVLCTGGMSVDPDDRTPLAIKSCGARVVGYGSPVLPGAMFMLAYTPAGVPIMGLPGCVMYAKRTVVDLILPRIMADLPVTAGDIAALGHAGLCLNCDICNFPNCGFGSGV